MRPSRCGRRFTGVLAAIILTASACSDEGRFGSPEIDISPSVTSGWLDPQPSPSASPTGAGSSPTPSHKASPAPNVDIFEIVLINSHPYYQPGQAIRVSAGTRIRFVNRDDKERQPFTDGGPYESPPIPPGGSHEFVTDRRGSWDLQDLKCPFCTGSLEVI